jgi:hypothetical protein
MDGGVEEAFAAALDGLSVARILFDVGDQPCIENALPIVRGEDVSKLWIPSQRERPNS